jgi:CHAD domain-containing protein
MPAGQALPLLLRPLQDAVRLHLQQVLADPHNPDDTPLHNLRVACRRTRSALRLLGRQVLPAAASAGAVATLRTLATATNRCRDLDVHLLALAQERRQLAAEYQPGLDNFRVYLQQQRQLEGERMRAALQQPALAEWDVLLTSSPGADAGALAQTRIVTVASRRIDRAYRRQLQQARALTPTADASALHALRIQAKKLRYLLELTQTLYPPRRGPRALRHLRRLQAVLGEVQDADVQRQGLLQFGADLSAAGADAATQVALEQLLALLALRQRQALDGVAAALAGFDRPAVRRLFRGLFGRCR